MDKIVQIKPKKLLIGFTGFITGYYLNSVAIFSISCLISMQYYWLQTLDKPQQEHFLIDINNLIKIHSEDIQIPYPYSIKYSFFIGYISGIVYQYLSMWLILAGITSGLTIAYTYTPVELETVTKQKLMKYTFTRRYLFDVDKIDKIDKIKWFYFI